MATIRERKGTYQIRVSLGYDMNGRQIVKTKSWTPTDGMTKKQIEKELNKQAVMFEEKCKSGLALDGSIRFAEYATRWMSINEDNLAPKTFTRYLSLLERINAAIGHIKLSDIRPHHLQEFYKNLAETGLNKKNGKKLSVGTILYHHRIASVILKNAYKQGYILRDISALVTPPKANQKEVPYLDEQDALRLCETLEIAPLKWKTALLLLLYTGMRRGELLGLEWPDVNFKDGTINIKRAVQYVTGSKYEYTDENGVFHKGKLIEKLPKTKSSIRCISIDDSVIGLLKEYNKWWLQQKLLNGDKWVETEKLFIRDNGGIMHPDSISSYVSKFVKNHNLPHFTPHSLRHTNISLMIASGVDIKTASSRAGHANITTTGNIYAHQIQSANARAAEKIGNILSGIQNNN